MATAQLTFNPRYSPRQELANSLTAGVGAALAACGAALLIVLACLQGGALRIVSSGIYGGTLILSYLAATLYHSLRSPKPKRVFKVLDHAAIFLLIAGTYTPFTLITLKGAWGWSLFGTVWGLGLLGILYKIFSTGRQRLLSTGLYIGLGWLAVVALQPLVEALPLGGLLLLVLGGASYSLGTFFYHRGTKGYHHAVWHLFVLAGSLFHYFAVLFYVLP